MMHKKADKTPYFPLFVDLSERDILFVGAGHIAARRILVLQPFASRITVVAPSANEAVQRLAEEGVITWIRRPFRDQDLKGRDGEADGAETDGSEPAAGKAGIEEHGPCDAAGENRMQAYRDLVFAATDDRALNARIASLCKTRVIPVNVASDHCLCDFYFPGIVQQGETVVGVSASGQDHHRARKIRERIQDVLADERPAKDRAVKETDGPKNPTEGARMREGMTTERPEETK